MRRALVMAGLMVAGVACQDFGQALQQCRDGGGCVDPSVADGGDVGGGQGGGTGGATGQAILNTSSTSLDFGKVALGSTASRSLTISNVGSAPTGTLQVAVVGASDFNANGCAGATLAVGASCSITVTYSAASGAASASATLGVTADSGGSVSVALSASPVGVELSLAPVGTRPPAGPQTFTTPAGTSISRVYTLRNDGLVSANGSPVITYSPSAAGFSATGCAGIQALGPTQSCTLTVTWAPLAVVAALNTTLRVTMGGDQATLSLVGEATPGGQVRVEAASGFDFGAVDTGQSPRKSFVVHNIGAAATAPLSVTGPAAPFALLGDTCTGVPLDADAGCGFEVAFTPPEYRTFNSTWTWDAGVVAGVVPMTLLGSGVDEVTLTLGTTGTGAGVVTSAFTQGGMRDGGTPACDAGSCAFPVRHDSVVTLTATPEAQSSDFIEWTGACTGANPSCSLPLSASAGATAQFRLKSVPVTVVVNGPRGRVTSTDGAIACASGVSTGCSASFLWGTTVTFAAAGLRSALTSVPGCSGIGGGYCTLTVTAPVTLTFTFAPVNTVFAESASSIRSSVTSGADTLCAQSALDAGLATAAHPGTWVAYRSNSTSTAAARILPGAAYGWVRVDGRPVTAGSMFSPARLRVPIALDEHGTVATNAMATAANADGSLSTNDCGNFTSSTAGTVAGGTPTATTGAWSSSGSQYCAANTALHFYCFELTSQQPITLPTRPPPGARVAFVSRFTLSGLAPDALVDAACADEAADAGFAGQFVAARASIGTSVLSRIGSPDAGMWYRVDGEPLALSPEEFLASDGRGVPLDLDSLGAVVPAGTSVWTGAATVTSVGVFGSTCPAAVSDGGTASGQVASLGDSQTNWAKTTSQCHLLNRFYCFQK